MPTLQAKVGARASAGRAVWPSLFAYQYVAVLRQDPAWASVDESPVRSTAVEA